MFFQNLHIIVALIRVLFITNWDSFTLFHCFYSKLEIWFILFWQGLQTQHNVADSGPSASHTTNSNQSKKRKTPADEENSSHNVVKHRTPIEEARIVSKSTRTKWINLIHSKIQHVIMFLLFNLRIWFRNLPSIVTMRNSSGF